MPPKRRELSALVAARLETCRLKIQQKPVQGYLVTNPVDQLYLTGFDGEDGASLILPKQVYLLTDGRFAEEAARVAPWATAVIRRGGLAEAVAEVAKKHHLKKIGFDPAQTSVFLHAALRKAARLTRWVAMPDFTLELRTIKDTDEIRRIERAIDVAETAFRHTVKRLKVGMTEREVAAELLHQMIRRGASGSSFPIIVAAGAMSSLPHARAGDRPIRAESPILIDWGATVDHYRSDLTRVVFIRRIPPRFRRMYQHVLSAQQTGIEAIRPGVPMADVDAQARRVLKQVGMDKAFAHGLGHGIGLDIHESPRLSARAKGVLAPGMVVTVEPGVYFPGIGGIRIEDDVLVTEGGHRVLTRLPKDLDSTVI